MSVRDNRLWNWVGQWSANVFLVAGGLWIVTAVLSVLEPLLGTSMQAPSSIAGFVGMVLAFVGLVGLYPELSDRTPGLAKVGVLLILLPLAFTFVLLVWHVPELFVDDWPSLLVYLPSPGLVYGGLFVLSAVGITLFGALSLRTETHPSFVGGFLLLLAGAWFFLIGAAVVYGFPLPGWVADVQGGMMAVALLGTGYLLRSGTESTDHADSVADSTA